MKNYKEIDISIIIPVLNEEGTLEDLYRQINKILNNLELDFEIIFIDDGSTDSSYEVIKYLSDEDFRVKSIKFKRNFGKAAALNEGFQLAKGNIVFTMDADLQDDPNEIPKFLQKINEGYDMVSGWKYVRHDPISKTLPSKLFNKTIAVASGLQIHDFNCGFKAYKKSVVKNIKLYGELHRYIPAIAHGKGFRVTEVKVEHHARKHGKSKYGIERFTRGLFDCITVVFLNRYNRRPLHFFGKFGILSGGLGVLICLYLTTLWFSGLKIGDRPLLNLGILLIILGVQFFSTGLIAEMLININYNNKNIQIEQIIDNSSSIDTMMKKI